MSPIGRHTIYWISEWLCVWPVYVFCLTGCLKSTRMWCSCIFFVKNRRRLQRNRRTSVYISQIWSIPGKSNTVYLAATATLQFEKANQNIWPHGHLQSLHLTLEDMYFWRISGLRTICIRGRSSLSIAFRWQICRIYYKAHINIPSVGFWNDQALRCGSHKCWTRKTNSREFQARIGDGTLSKIGSNMHICARMIKVWNYRCAFRQLKHFYCQPFSIIIKLILSIFLSAVRANRLLAFKWMT